MDYAKESLRLHGEWKGKIEVKATVPVGTKDARVHARRGAAMSGNSEGY